ncbi:hypothetical protein ACFLU6_00280 [Acidobacteriota bacterium]
MGELPHYQYRGARTMVLLHEQQLRNFFQTWKRAKAEGIALPQTGDSDYSSMDALLRHILRAARGYMTWMCQVLELPDPAIPPTPEASAIDAEAESYLENLLKQWREPLSDVQEKRFYKPEYTSRWKVNYCIDAMMEHAVMHPIRHTFQLEELIGS